MKSTTIVLLTFTLLIFGCSEGESLSDNPQMDKTEMIFENKVIPYPMGSSLDPDNDVLLWDNLDPDRQEGARLKARRITIDALRISNKITRNLDGYGDEDLPELIKKAERIFHENSDSRALLLAKQIFAMKVQEGLFPDFIRTPDYSTFNSIELSDNQVKLLRYSTRQMLESGNSNADMALLNLTLLKEDLAEQEISQYAQLAVSNAKSWYKIENCENCNLKKPVPEMSKKERVINSIKVLESFR